MTLISQAILNTLQLKSLHSFQRMMGHTRLKSMAWHSRHHHRGGSPGESPRSRFRVASKPRLSQTLRSQTPCTPFLAGKFRHHSPHHLLSIGFLHAGICSPWFIHVHPLKSPPKLRIQKFVAKQGTDVVCQQYMSYHVFILEESLKTPDVSGICFDPLCGYIPSISLVRSTFLPKRVKSSGGTWPGLGAKKD